MQTECDHAKALADLAKHGVSFHEAVTSFDDPNAVTGFDPRQSADEDRFLTAGISNRGRLLIVWHTNRGESIRIIGARRATPRERTHYHHD